MAGAVAATLWWLVPLLVSVRYGVRFTDYTEPAALTTLTESATEVLRGTGNWLSFLHTDGGLWLPGDCYTDPSQTTQGLAKKARERGAEVYRHTKVTAIARTNSGEWRIETLHDLPVFLGADPSHAWG